MAILHFTVIFYVLCLTNEYNHHRAIKLIIPKYYNKAIHI